MSSILKYLHEPTRWYKCDKCQVFINSPVKFLQHLGNHQVVVTQVDAVLLNAAVEIEHAICLLIRIPFPRIKTDPLILENDSTSHIQQHWTNVEIKAEKEHVNPEVSASLGVDPRQYDDTSGDIKNSFLDSFKAGVHGDLQTKKLLKTIATRRMCSKNTVLRQIRRRRLELSSGQGDSLVVTTKNEVAMRLILPGSGDANTPSTAAVQTSTCSASDTPSASVASVLESDAIPLSRISSCSRTLMTQPRIVSRATDGSRTDKPSYGMKKPRLPGSIDKAQRKKQQNKTAANLYRHKKKLKFTLISAQEASLEEMNNELQEQRNELHYQILMHKQFLRAVRSNCKLKRDSSSMIVKNE